MALKTEMNKVDVIVDGRSVAGMYQVVHHRYETISTTTAVVPRSADDPHHHQVQQNVDPNVPSGGKTSGPNGGRYTPLSALASLQPGGAPPAGPPGPPAGPPSFQHFAPHQGFYQPAGPLIRSASPGGSPSAAQ